MRIYRSMHSSYTPIHLKVPREPSSGSTATSLHTVKEIGDLFGIRRESVYRYVGKETA